MRHSIVFGIVIISILSIFNSCKSEKTEALLAEIEGMQLSVDSSQKVFQAMDTAKIFSYKKNSEAQIKYLETFFKDTIYENARYIDVYYGNYKLLRKITRGYPKLVKEIEFSKEQLYHLKNDVKNGFAADSNYQKYISGEKLAVKNIAETTSTLINWEEKGITRYENMVASIDSIITEMKNQGLRE